MALVDLELNPSRRELRVFAAVWFPAFCLVVAGVLYARVSEAAAMYVAAGGCALGLVGFFVPPAIRYVYIGLMCLTFPIGFVVSHVVMAVIFFGVFTPIGAVMRVFGYDPMKRKRKREPDADTYWTKRDGDRDRASYFRQF